MAFTKNEKKEIVAGYEEKLKSSQAVYIVEYGHMTMKDIDALRAKVRDAGGEVHVCKNTLFSMAMKNAGFPETTLLEGTSLVGFALSDPPSLAKVINDASKNVAVYKIKGGFLGVNPISAAEIKSLAELPPLPVMRSKLLGLLQAPASQLVRTLAEPARSMACVLKGYSEKEAAQPA
ncbi:MAG: 50S ribosomal protein L10 [Anaerolineaceae bacterium]